MESFPQVQKGVLSLKRDGTFKKIKKISDDVPSEYNVHNFLKVKDISRYIIGEPLDLKFNPFQEGKADTNMDGIDDTRIGGMYPSRPFTHSQEKDSQDLQVIFMENKYLEKLDV